MRCMSPIQPILLLVVACTCGTARGDCPRYWRSGSHLPGMRGAVYAMTAFDNGSGYALYAGGSFSTAGNSLAADIARWDGERWQALAGETTGGASPRIKALTS